MHINNHKSIKYGDLLVLNGICLTIRQPLISGNRNRLSGVKIEKLAFRMDQVSRFDEILKAALRFAQSTDSEFVKWYIEGAGAVWYLIAHFTSLRQKREKSSVEPHEFFMPNHRHKAESFVLSEVYAQTI